MQLEFSQKQNDVENRLDLYFKASFILALYFEDVLEKEIT